MGRDRKCYWVREFINLVSNCGFLVDRDYNVVVNLKIMCRSSFSFKGFGVCYLR